MTTLADQLRRLAELRSEASKLRAGRLLGAAWSDDEIERLHEVTDEIRTLSKQVAQALAKR